MTTPDTAPVPASTERPTRVLLVDDQAIVGESVRRMLADDPTVEFVHCTDPAQALATANAFAPTVILQDLVMPEIDGLLLVKFFRANPSTKETPMIVLSSKEEPIIKAKAFALGANDYLVKLPDKLELAARVRYHSQAYRNLLERNEAFAQLAESQAHLAAEVNQAARYVKSLLPSPLRGDVTAAWKFVPSTQLGGDMFGYHWIDSDHLAIYLLDVSGHGVGSSLLAVSAANVISGRSLPGVDFREPAAVMAGLNDVFQMERQDGKYFTIFYSVFVKATRTLRYCNAAHPAALLFDPIRTGPESLKELPSDNPVIGMLPPGIPFDGAEVSVPPNARLLIFSDGVFEIEQTDGEFWPAREFVSWMTEHATDDTVMDSLYEHARMLHGGGTLADDFSILDVRF
jgi:sigma-B regulation protein RsbU (phosphoserine phosphatase)